MACLYLLSCKFARTLLYSYFVITLDMSVQDNSFFFEWPNVSAIIQSGGARHARLQPHGQAAALVGLRHGEARRGRRVSDSHSPAYNSAYTRSVLRLHLHMHECVFFTFVFTFECATCRRARALCPRGARLGRRRGLALGASPPGAPRASRHPQRSGASRVSGAYLLTYSVPQVLVHSPATFFIYSDLWSLMRYLLYS